MFESIYWLFLKMQYFVETIADNESPNENKQTADMFFNKIMMDTNTHITWPTRLKAGTKTKKNPFVNIAGRYSNVAMAKSKILKHLENKVNWHQKFKLKIEN